MKKNNRNPIYPFILMGVFLVSYNSCKKETVKKDVVINWENPVDIVSGIPLTNTQLNATSDVSGEFVYKPAIGTVLGIGANQVLKVYFTPKDQKKYNFAYKTVTISVTKIDPVITWANPADIIYGTVLSTTQLNAAIGAKGTFVYTPQLGTKLKVGLNQNLTVNFLPLDTINYRSVSKTVKINVTPTINIQDIDGNVYHTVVIGTQVWMKENLKTTKYNDGTPIPLVTDNTEWSNSSTSFAPGYCWYYNDNVSFKAYGALYNWATVATDKVCPTGWHVPSYDEWVTLQMTVYNYGWEIAKSLADSIGWANCDSINTVGNDQLKNNLSEFTAVPSGMRSGYNGAFGGIGYYDRWWTSIQTSGSQAYAIELSNSDSLIWFYKYRFSNLANGHSIRCLKD